MRTLTIYNNPVAAPGVCARCGSQDKDWFADMGFELDMNKYEPSLNLPVWFDGIVYLCCDCVNDIISDLRKAYKHFQIDHDVKVTLNGIGTDTSDVVTSANGDNQESDSDDRDIESDEQGSGGFIFTGSSSGT